MPSWAHCITGSLNIQDRKGSIRCSQEKLMNISVMNVLDHRNTCRQPPGLVAQETSGAKQLDRRPTCSGPQTFTPPPMWARLLVHGARAGVLLSSPDRQNCKTCWTHVNEVGITSLETPETDPSVDDHRDLDDSSLHTTNAHPPHRSPRTLQDPYIACDACKLDTAQSLHSLQLTGLVNGCFVPLSGKTKQSLHSPTPR